MRRAVAAAVVLAALAGATGGQAAAQQQVDQPESREIAGVPTVVRRDLPRVTDVPSAWEVAGLTFPVLDRSLIVAVHEDDNQLLFLDGNELGSFRPAPLGGTPFFGSGQPIFGLAAPPLLPSGVLRALGSGDTGDRFLGRRPPVDPTSVIPKLDETFDQRRTSFAFIGAIPPIPDVITGSGSLAFPLTDTVLADPVPGCLDPDPRCVVDPAPSPPSTPPPTFAPGPVPTTAAPLPDAPPGVPLTTAAPPPTSPPSTSPPTTVAPTIVPTTAPATTTPTTAPPAGTTTTLPATTTTSRPSPTTTTAPTTTTTVAPTTTIAPSPSPPAPAPAPTTTTTTTPAPTTAFVLSNQREAGALCLSNATGGTHNPGCDRLFDFGGTEGYMRTGVDYRVNLTLWNIPAHSDTDATKLRTFSSGGCTSSPNAASHPDSLCKAVELVIQRYSDAGRTTPSECVYGGGSGTTCTFDPTRTLAHFGATHTSMGTGAEIGNGFQVDAKAYLRITVRIPSTGVGAQNRLIGQDAFLPMTWRMETD